MLAAGAWGRRIVRAVILKAGAECQSFGASSHSRCSEAKLTMKKMSEKDLIEYLSKITDEALYSYNVYQIEGEGRSLFTNIDGDEDTIMGLPIKKIKDYLKKWKNI